MDIIEDILSDKLNKDIINIIITELWKNRFNNVVKCVKGVYHSHCCQPVSRTNKPYTINIHRIEVSRYIKFRYHSVSHGDYTDSTTYSNKIGVYGFIVLEKKMKNI